MRIWIAHILAVIVSYLIASINPAIELSKAIYHTDVRTLGSGNPGFTNFRRSFGGRYAWLVFLLDVVKSLVPCLAAGLLYRELFGLWQVGVSVAGFAAMLGHAYPLWYCFKGGKCVLVGGAYTWLVDWRVGLIVTAVALILLVSFRYMSLATMSGAVAFPIALAAFGFQTPAVMVIAVMAMALLLFRHRENICRLIRHEEPKFTFSE
ncbi:MAG: glycerol-3-phosphate acyltransferase [Oscillospiraceae bacterium]|nr:glycerol-3-phosphate acyltransferase [Oscillospiraceae bacterium]